MQNLNSSTISGVGAYLPPNIVSSSELMLEAETPKMGISENFLERVSGIKERRFSEEKELPSDLAIRASQSAMEDAGIDPLDIDCVLFCGIDRDYAEPATAHFVAASLGLRNARNCFDISNACHGMMSGVSVAIAYISMGMAENVLVCTGEKPSYVATDVCRQIRKNRDKKAFRNLVGALTLGDSGGAFIISKSRPSSEEGFYSMDFSSRGEFADYCFIKYTDFGVKFQMLMEKICNVGIEMHQEMIGKTYDKLGWEPDSVGKVYCHQTGERPHIRMAELARQPINKAPKTYPEFGNLTSATIAVTMHLFKPRPGERVMILSAGSGVSVGQSGLVYRN